jgi:hypothetical protein
MRELTGGNTREISDLIGQLLFRVLDCGRSSEYGEKLAKHRKSTDGSWMATSGMRRHPFFEQPFIMGLTAPVVSPTPRGRREVQIPRDEKMEREVAKATVERIDLPVAHKMQRL